MLSEDSSGSDQGSSYCSQGCLFCSSEKECVCVLSSSQPQCPCALASLPPPLCVSLFTGNAGKPHGWLSWCEATWRLQRARNLACQAGQYGASRQSIKYSILHSQFMDLIPQKRPPSKIYKKNNLSRFYFSHWLDGKVYHTWGEKATCQLRSRRVLWSSFNGFIFTWCRMDCKLSLSWHRNGEESFIESKSSKAQCNLYKTISRQSGCLPNRPFFEFILL